MITDTVKMYIKNKQNCSYDGSCSNMHRLIIQLHIYKVWPVMDIKNINHKAQLKDGFRQGAACMPRYVKYVKNCKSSGKPLHGR